MKNDFEVITHKFDDDIIIYPISDVHLGAAEHLTKEWKSFCNYVLEQPNVYLTLGGDLINNATRSSVSNVFEETMRPREQKKIMTEMLSPIKSRILCAVSGNHENRSLKDADDDPTYDIMCKLDLEHLYRPNMAFVKILIGDRGEANPSHPRSSYHFGVIHGAGGGTTGAAINRNEKFGTIIDGLDCLIVGHTHKGAMTKPGKLVFDSRNSMVTRKGFAVVVSVPWLEFGGYALRGQLTPSVSGDPQIIRLARRPKKLTLVW